MLIGIAAIPFHLPVRNIRSVIKIRTLPLLLQGMILKTVSYISRNTR